MNSRRKQPEELGKNRLLSLAMVMKDIQDYLDQGLTVADGLEALAQVEPYATNDYFWARDDCFGKGGDTGGGSYSYNKEDLKKSRLEMLDYLREEGAIVGHDLIKETREVRPKIESFVKYDFYGSWYTVEVMQPSFSALYIRVKKLAEPYLHAYQEQTTIKPVAKQPTSRRSTSQAGTEPSDTPLPLNLSELHLYPSNYDKNQGVLHLDRFHRIEIVQHGKVKRPDGKKYDQPRLMECVFKTVKTQKDGTTFSTILSVNVSKIGDKEQRKIENAVAEINKKAKEQAGLNNLIKILKNKVYLNSSYL